MKKLLLLLLLFAGTFIKADVNLYNEYKVDLYYANGIMMQDSEEKSEEIWRRKVKILLQNKPLLRDRVSGTHVSYNISEGMIADLWEAFNQEVRLNPKIKLGWISFKSIVSKMGTLGKATGYVIKANEIADRMIHDDTLKQQKEKYINSIKLGHGVVVVAHSQGNLFAKEAFKQLPSWMKPYYHTIAVATPDSKIKIPNNGNGVTFYNDIITLINSGTKFNIDNVNKHDYNQINRVGENLGLLKDQKSIQYHGFDYYLGYPVYENMLMTGSKDVVRREKRKTDEGQKLILTWLYDEIMTQGTRESQWKLNKKTNEGTEKYRILLTHKGDPSNIKSDSDIYPFNLNGKLYQIRDSGKYVIASFGGEKILDEWSDKKDNQFYKLEGTYPVEYIKRFTRDDTTEIVTDHKLGLMWQDDSEAKTVTKPWVTQEHWNTKKYKNTSGDTAATYCKNLTLGSFSDWRLPDTDELSLLLDEKYHNPSINTTFKNATSEHYWASITASDGVYAGFVNFGSGGQNGNFNYNTYYVRCIRVGQ